MSYDLIGKCKLNPKKSKLYLSMLSYEKQPIVIDNGSSTCRVGFATEYSEGPLFSIPSIVARQKNDLPMVARDYPSYYGEEALKRNNSCYKLQSPIDCGQIKSWDYLLGLWHHSIYNCMKINPQQHPFLISEAAGTSKKLREDITEKMFEYFQVPALYLASRQMLSLFGLGRATGLVVQSGDTYTRVVPIHQGITLLPYMQRANFGGRDLTKYMGELLVSNKRLDNPLKDYPMKNIKQKMCQLYLDSYINNRKINTENHYQLPDGKILKIGNQGLQCSEGLFQTDLIGKKLPGIHELAYICLQKCDIQLRRQFYGNILLSGGTTMMRGLPQRIGMEVNHFAPSSMRVKVNASPLRKDLSFIGGTILSTLSTFQSLWITKQQYQEEGSVIINRKSQ